VVQLFSVIGIGIAVGGLIGFGISYLTQRFDLPLVEQSLTLVSAYGTYIIAEELGGSGVIAVVTAGLILGNFGSRIGMNPRTRVIVSEFWEFLAFFVNSIVFLLIGDQVRFVDLAENLNIITVTIAGMVLARAIAVYGLGFLSNRLANSNIPLPEQTILWWGGLRGSVSIALALSVPNILTEREDLINTVFGVVLFTLLVQGLTTKPLLEKLKLLGDQPLRQEYLELVARQTALKRVLTYLGQVEKRPGLDPEFYRYQEALIKGELKRLEEQIDKLQDDYPNLRSFTAEQLRMELLAVEADTYAEFVRSGRLNQELAPFLQDILEDGY
jgi:CPA1 family monovalent cation:H+ antiporter